MNRYVRHFMSFGALALMVLFSSFSHAGQKTPSKNQAPKNVPTPPQRTPTITRKPVRQKPPQQGGIISQAITKPQTAANVGQKKPAAQHSYADVINNLKQDGTVDAVANAKVRYAGRSKNADFTNRVSNVKKRSVEKMAARSNKTSAALFQPSLDCQIPVQLIQEDTVIIDEPGYYILDCVNLDYEVNPLGFVPAIQIVSEDVTLDLNGLTIRQADPSIPFGYAIQIGYGYFPANLAQQNFVAKNITIKNGTVKQFSGNGILAFNNTFGTLSGDPATTEAPFEDIHLYNLDVLECGVVTTNIDDTDLLGISGISFFALNDGGSFGDTPTYGFKNIVVDDVHVNDSAGPAPTAFTIFRGENVIISNTTANNTIGTEFDDPGYPIPYSVAAFYVEGKNIQMFQCQGNGTKDLHTGVFSQGAQIGSFFQGSFDFYMSECQFNDTYGENNLIINVNPSNTIGWLAENCQFNNNQGGLGAGIVCGVHLSDSVPQVTTANGMKWVNCQFNNHSVNPANTRSSLVCGYIAITATNVEFDNCQACNITSESSAHRAMGILNATGATDPLFPFGNVTSTVFRGCTVSNIVGNRGVYGLGASYVSGNRAQQSVSSNVVVENCVVSKLRSYSTDPLDKIAGIAQLDLIPSESQPDAFVLPISENFLVKNSRVSDVHHYPDRSQSEKPNTNSAGILLESVMAPTLLENSVTDCDKGILLTGTRRINPNAFQLATSEEDALANPPIPINIGTSTVLTITVPGLPNPLPANYTFLGPRLEVPLTAEVEVADPQGACSTLVNDLTGKIGIIIFEGACPIDEAIERVEAAGAIATIIINFSIQGTPVFRGIPNQTKPALSLNANEGQALLDQLDLDPNLEVTITPYFPEFVNVTRGNESVVVSLVDRARDLLYPDEDLTALGWQVGDEIQFIANGTTIAGLVDGGIYSLIVYRPGFTKNGVIQDNVIQKNRVYGIQDKKFPCTSSQFVTNNSFCNGTTHEDNYRIHWGSKDHIPVAQGSLSNYPKPKYWSYNISTVCGHCDCEKKKHHHHHKNH